MPVTDATSTGYPMPWAARTASVTAKAGLLLLLALAMLYPEASHMKDKAAGLRTVAYPILSFAVPAAWWLFWRDRFSFPWLPDLLVTLTCFSDVLGNRIDLYDTVFWFDDWMHFANMGLLTTAFVLLTLDPRAGFGATLERSLAFAGVATIGWEIAEYFAFIAGSTERHFAYADTLGDLGLGMLGAIVGAVVVHQAWQQGRLGDTWALPLSGAEPGVAPPRPGARA